jgi:hypothetical protein
MVCQLVRGDLSHGDGKVDVLLTSKRGPFLLFFFHSLIKQGTDLLQSRFLTSLPHRTLTSSNFGSSLSGAL